MAHELGALRGFSALAQKPDGKSDRNRGSLWGGVSPCGSGQDDQRPQEARRPSQAAGVSWHIWHGKRGKGGR